MIRFPGSQEKTQAGFQVAFDTVDKEPMFATLGKDPVRGKRFGGAMASLTGGEGYEVKYLIDNYDWESINERAGTVVDVGGSHGFVCVELAEKFDKMKFVVQDLPNMVASAPKLEGDLAERITFQGYDFYTPQPMKGADGMYRSLLVEHEIPGLTPSIVYLFRWIFHNNPDLYATKILHGLIPALKKGAKVVINDHCLPEPGQESLWDEKIIRFVPPHRFIPCYPSFCVSNYPPKPK